ncbi:hypothetical protein ACIGCM_03840 [Pseudomonas sp. NPDC078700]|uniref:hypothetical protein n=1 Tax=Pseudomonas sp. NPDC078700 TaxID=3364424 RepID=UPI0037C6300A
MNLQMMAAEAALRKMIDQSYFDICTLDKIISMLSIKPNADAYSILHTLHCVHYNQMPRELFEALPQLIAKVLQSPSFDSSRINIAQNGSALRIVKN